MEIKLSDEDFERLAIVLERRITDRVVGLAMQNPAWDVMTEKAKSLALMHIGTDTYRAQAVDSLQKHLEGAGKNSLRQMVRQAVAAVHANDPELRKAAARGVYEAAMENAERLRPECED